MQNKNIDRLPKKWTWRKPKGKPKRPLSAYNIFFANVRQELLAERTSNHGIGFRNLAQAVAERWKDLDPVLKEPYVQKAKTATARYKEELSLWEGTRKGVVDPDCEIAVIKVISPPKETPNDSIFMEHARHCPISNTSRNGTTEYWTAEQIPVRTPTSNDNLNSSSQYFVSSASRSAQACVTPTSLARSLFPSNNEARSNMMHDHTYEPLPFLHTMENWNDTIGSVNYPIEDLDAVNNPSYTTDIFQTNITHDDNELGFGRSGAFNDSYNEQYEPLGYQCNDNDFYNCTLHSLQLEAFLKSMEH